MSDNPFQAPDDAAAPSRPRPGTQGSGIVMLAGRGQRFGRF